MDSFIDGVNVVEDNVIWGKQPKVGDKVYIDFGDGCFTGGEAVGVIDSIKVGKHRTIIVVDGQTYFFDEMVHIEVLDG